MHRIVEEVGDALAVVYSQSNKREDAHFGCKRVLSRYGAVLLLEQLVVFFYEIGKQIEECRVERGIHAVALGVEHGAVKRRAQFAVLMGHNLVVERGEHALQFGQKLGVGAERHAYIFVLNLVGLGELPVHLLQLIHVLLDGVLRLEYLYILSPYEPCGKQRHHKQHHKQRRGKHEIVALAAYGLISVLLDDRQYGSEVDLTLARVVESYVVERKMYVSAGAVVIVFIYQFGEEIKRRYLAGTRNIVVDGRPGEIHLLHCPSDLVR